MDRFEFHWAVGIESAYGSLKDGSDSRLTAEVLMRALLFVVGFSLSISACSGGSEQRQANDAVRSAATTTTSGGIDASITMPLPPGLAAQAEGMANNSRLLDERCKTLAIDSALDPLRPGGGCPRDFSVANGAANPSQGESQ